MRYENLRTDFEDRIFLSCGTIVASYLCLGGTVCVLSIDKGYVGDDVLKGRNIRNKPGLYSVALQFF